MHAAVYAPRGERSVDEEGSASFDPADPASLDRAAETLAGELVERLLAGGAAELDLEAQPRSPGDLLTQAQGVAASWPGTTRLAVVPVLVHGEPHAQTQVVALAAPRRLQVLREGQRRHREEREHRRDDS